MTAYVQRGNELIFTDIALSDLNQLSLDTFKSQMAVMVLGRVQSTIPRPGDNIPPKLQVNITTLAPMQTMSKFTPKAVDRSCQTFSLRTPMM